MSNGGANKSGELKGELSRVYPPPPSRGCGIARMVVYVISQMALLAKRAQIFVGAVCRIVIEMGHGEDNFHYF